MDLQELQETAYFDILKCIVYTGEYNFNSKILLTKLRKALGVPMDQHTEWHKNLEAAQKDQTFSYERVSSAPNHAGAPPAPAAVEPPLAMRNSLVASSVGHVAPPAASAAAPPTSAAAAKAAGAPQPIRTTSLAAHYQADTPPRLKVTGSFDRLLQAGPDPNPLTNLGRQVKRLWDGKWIVAYITDYKADSGKHCLTYDLGSKKESYEEVKLTDLDINGIEYTGVQVDLLAQYPTSRAVKNSGALGASRTPGSKSKRRAASNLSSGGDTDEDEDMDD